MIINREKPKAEISTNVLAITGTIAMNAEMFALVIKGIYDDEILAAVREPLFNAVDAHVMNGNQHLALEIHSPTDLEPYYSVRDFGPGMAPEMVETTFMTLGDSTKRDRNDQVGAKGVGSKAPLATTDMFTVVSIQNGVRSVYTVYMNEGLPTVSPLSSNETCERDGVEIKFAVDPSEIPKFRAALIKCLQYVHFPFVVNDPFITQEIKEGTLPVQYTYEEDGWILNMYSKQVRGRNRVVLMGQQPYRSKALDRDYNWPLMTVTVPIGACDVNPGREWTVEGRGDNGFGEKLSAFVDKAIKVRKQEVFHQLSKAKTFAEYQEKLAQIGGYFANICGGPFLHKRFKKAIEADGITDCEIYGGTGRKRYTGTYTSSDINNRMPIIINDDDRHVRAKCNYLAEKLGKSVHIVGGLEVRKLAADPFFEGFVQRLSELEKRPRESSGGYSQRDYVPGHRVAKYDHKTGSLTFPRISKAEFADIENVMFFEGGSVKGRCSLGWMDKLKDQSEDFFKALSIRGDLWLVPESRVKWLDQDVRFISDDEINQVIEREFLPRWLSHIWSRDKEYVTAVDEVRHLGVKVERHVYRPVVMLDFNNLTMTQSSTYRKYEDIAKEHLRRKTRIAKKYVKKVVDRYPLLKYTGMEHFNKPEVVQYRQMIDNKGE